MIFKFKSVQMWWKPRSPSGLRYLWTQPVFSPCHKRMAWTHTVLKVFSLITVVFFSRIMHHRCGEWSLSFMKKRKVPPKLTLLSLSGTRARFRQRWVCFLQTPCCSWMRFHRENCHIAYTVLLFKVALIQDRNQLSFERLSDRVYGSCSND